MDRPSSDRMGQKSGFGMGSITAKTAQLLSTAMGVKNIASMERSGTMELRSSQDGKQRSPFPRKNFSARVLSKSPRIIRLSSWTHAGQP